MHRVFPTALLFLAALSVNAAENATQAQKPPWAWTDAERFALLTDDAAAAARVQADREAKHSSAIKVKTHAFGRVVLTPEPYDIIKGKRDPHLFFPFELLGSMVALGFADDPITRSAYRGSKEQHRKELQLPEDFWERLESISAPYRATLIQEREIGLSGGSTDDIGPQLCRDRHAVLVEAQRQFGPAFMRFLYVAVARTSSSVVLQKPGPELLKVATGECE